MLQEAAKASERSVTATAEAIEFLSVQLSKTLDAQFSRTILPAVGESCVVTMDAVKTAALFFDRVWSPSPYEGEYKDVFFFGGTELEVWMGTVVAITSHTSPEDPPLFDPSSLLLNSPLHRAVEMGDSNDLPSGMARALSESIEHKHGIAALPMFISQAAQQRAYEIGDRRMLVASIQGLNLIDDECLTWEQVLEVRRDPEAMAKLRKLRHWVDSTMEGKPVAYVTDAIGSRLSDYEWSLKKHGIETVIGSMQSLLDPKFLVAASVVGAGLSAGFGAACGVGAASLAIVGKTVCSIGEKFLDLADARRTDNAEVAFVHDIKKLQDKNPLGNSRGD
jgi:hypothetical protein